jgi:fumarate reductase iron-sulfur subunit
LLWSRSPIAPRADVVISANEGQARIARFRLDPRDTQSDIDYYDLVGDDDGAFGCMSLLACHDVCPKNLPLATQIAFLRRKMVAVGI